MTAMTQPAQRHALVLASSAGIGLACAASLVENGHPVCLNGRDPARLAEAERSIKDLHPHAAVRSCVADLNISADRRRIVEQAGNTDILVLNMGGPGAHSDAPSLEDWQATFEAMFLPMVDILDRTLPGMLQREWGRVVMISSAAVKQPIPNLLESGVFRSGLASLLAVRATQAAGRNVTINTILPGRILTERQNNALARDARIAGISQEAHLRQVCASIPMGRLGCPREVGSVCAFLCSEGAGYVTGQSILVDGGAYRGMY
jgi:3-oxoacyl-[acyl-carrier protein] reductase